MSFWRKQSGGGDGWTAVVLDSKRIAIADVVRRRDERPQVRSCDSFAREGTDLEALKRLKKANRLARNRCTILLDAGQYQLLQVERPDMLPNDAPHSEVRDAMRWRIKELVDFPVDQAGVDVLDIPAQGQRAQQMWVVAASHAILRPRIQMFQEAKVSLAAIDVPELAQRNLSGLFEEENRGLALVAFQDTGGRLTITFGGELYMTRHLDATSLELANPNAVTQHERVLLDIQRSLDNFDRNYSAIPVNCLWIGPLPGGEAFIEYLRSTLSIPV